MPKQPRIHLGMAFDREEFKRICKAKHKGVCLLIELTGISQDCLGALYKRGAGPEWRKRICEALGVEEQRLFGPKVTMLNVSLLQSKQNENNSFGMGNYVLKR